MYIQLDNPELGRVSIDFRAITGRSGCRRLETLPVRLMDTFRDYYQFRISVFPLSKYFSIGKNGQPLTSPSICDMYSELSACAGRDERTPMLEFGLQTTAWRAPDIPNCRKYPNIKYFGDGYGRIERGISNVPLTLYHRTTHVWKAWVNSGCRPLIGLFIRLERTFDAYWTTTRSLVL